MTGRQALLTLFLSLLVLTQVLEGWSLLVQPAYAAANQAARSTPPSFTFQQYLKQGPQPAAPRKGTPSPYPQPARNTKAAPLTVKPSAEPASMKPISQSLSSAFLAGGNGTGPLDLKGSDGRVEVQVPPGSVDLSHATVAGGKAPVGSLTLQVTQAYGHYVGMLTLLGSYTLQVVDSLGQPLSGIVLRTPITIRYHYQPAELDALGLDPAHILLSWPTLLAAARAAKQPTTSLVIPMQNDPLTRTLTARSSVLGPGPFTPGGDTSNQLAPIPHLAEVQGNNGQLAYSYPLKVVPGSGGFTPQLALTYSSMAPNDRHSATSPANDEGDGFSLSLGSISADTYPDTGATWYFINGIDNVGDRLIQYDSTNKLYYTEHLSYLRIQQVTSSITNQPCFDVWDKAGAFYEVGCTSDSLEYTMVSGVQHTYQWNVDRIIAPNEGAQGTTSTAWRLMLISYLQDCGSASSTQPCPSGNTIRDAVIKQITYGYNTTGGTLTSLDATAGTIDFLYHAPFNFSSGTVNWATAYGTNYNCSQSPPDSQTTTLRCDDPIQKSGGFAPPNAMGTFSLTTINSYLNSDGSASNLAYSYALTYTDTPFQNCTDPITGTNGYCAGEHLLTQLTPSVYQSGSQKTLRATTFSYTSYADTYYDSLHTGAGSQPFTTSTNWQYLSGYHDLDSGIGASIVYQRAYSNTDGTPTLVNGQGQITDDRYDALYCTVHSSDCSTGSYSGHYAHPDDHAWSAQVVTSITSSGKDSSTLSQATTTYSYYRLAYTGTYSGSGAWCFPDQLQPVREQDCVGDNWLPNNNSDWADYYHAEFRGFAQVWTQSPAGDLTVGYYLSTEGWYQPATDPLDYLGGQLYQQEVYQGTSYDPTKLLSRTVNVYPGPNPVNSTTNPTACATPTGSSPYAACDLALLSSTTTDYEGSNSSSAPWVEHDYSYDDYDTTNGLNISTHYHNQTQEVIKGSNLPASVYPLKQKWSYATNASADNASGWIYHTVNTVSHSEIDDSSGHIWQCQYSSYDEGNTNPTPSAGWATTVSTYSSSNCAGKSSPLTTTYQAYDAFGHVVASVDAFGAGTPSLYQSSGCTTSSTIEIMSSAWTQGRYTTCANYDSAHYQALPISSSNAFSQLTSYSYDATQGNALVSTTDPNTQVTSMAYSYDGSGNTTVQSTLPLHSGGYTTQANSSSTCTGSSTLPCYEVDRLSYQYNTVLSSTFYDSQGRAVETSTPGPVPANPQSGKAYYTIVFTTYNDAQHSTFQSLPFVVAISSSQHGSGYIDPNGATDYLGNPVGGTATYFDALGRALAVKDPLFGSSGEPGIACSSVLSGTYTACTTYGVGQVSGDSTYYLAVTSIDPNKHVAVSDLDALGRTVYTQQDSGVYGGTLTVNRLTTTAYNALDKATSIVVTDKAPQSGQTITSVTTSMQYDDLGRLTQLADPDRGTHSYSYDPDGRVIADVSGTRTIGSVYDLLGRVGCVQDASPSYSPTGACTSGATPDMVNTYDTSKLTISGTTDYPVGRLSKSIAYTRYPGSSLTTVSTLFEHDARGRLVAEQLQFTNLPSGWNVTSALPTYQAQYRYNDADQLTTTTTSTTPAGQGFTTTQVYDSATGVSTGLSNNGTATANLATLSYTSSAQLGSLNFLSSTGGALAGDSYGYDGNLRLSSMAATWQAGSGNTGASFSQNLTYDVASNLTSLATTQAAVTGNSSTGGSETQVFCYDEQNRLVWAGNSGTPSCTGNGTPSVSGYLNAYSASYVYTHLGHLWQGPLAGSGEYQYLYCASSQPHQLSGLYALGATCSSKTGQGYTSSYDSWGNVSSRTYSGTTGTLSYDLLDHFTKWFVSSSNSEFYAYDAAGNRVLRRATNGSGTTMTVYAFGLEEHQYSGSGGNQGNTYYYSLAGRLLGSLDSNGTQFYLTDALGSVVSAFTNAAGGAALKGNQLFGPYGNARYYAGSINTAKGFIGQYNDGTGLDYLHARYYDPVVGVFLSADTVQGNAQGLNPYAYVNGNPQTYSDPSGRYVAGTGGQIYYPPASSSSPQSAGNAAGNGVFPWRFGNPFSSVGGGSARKFGNAFAGGGSTTSALSSCGGIQQSDCLQALWATQMHVNLTMRVTLGGGGCMGGGLLGGVVVTTVCMSGPGVNVNVSGSLVTPLAGCASVVMCLLQDEPVDDSKGAEYDVYGEASGGCALSFTPTTVVATARGEQAIGTMKVGDKVWAYNATTHKMELEPVLHVWINQDNDLVDLTLTSSTHLPQSGKLTRKSEVIHTNKKHPFLTREKGFLPVGQIKLGMHVLRADGTYGVVTGWKVVPGIKAMYNLEVAHDHTFTVGVGQWVVHNCNFGSNKAPIDMDHILEGHSNGTYESLLQRAAIGDQSAINILSHDTFFVGQTDEEIAKIVREAWINRAKAGSQQIDPMGVVRQMWQGMGRGWQVEGWYNLTERIVETAYPISPWRPFI